MKVAVFRVIAMRSLVEFTDVSEVLAPSTIGAMTHRPEDGREKTVNF
jgi:hypothetical protein